MADKRKKQKRGSARTAGRRPQKSGAGPARKETTARRKNAAVRENRRGQILRGRIQGNAKGFGFFIPEDGGEDLFIPPKAMNGAMHNDIVEARKVSSFRGAGEAEVVRIIERGYRSIVGTFEAGADGGYVSPDCANIARDIYIPADGVGRAKNGEKVLVEITAYPAGRMPRGKITEVLGLPNEKGVDVLSVIRAHGMKEKFPRKVEAAATGTEQTVPPEKLRGRRDFRDELIITIDGDDSRDFDDAVTVRRDNGDFILGVHIADVAEYVRAGDPIDEEAMRRGTSVYLCDRVLPMLPVQLSNGICSLNEGVDRLTLSVIMRIAPDGTVKSGDICEGVIRSKARMTYAKVAKILGGDPELNRVYAFLRPMLDDMKALADIRTAMRRARGAIEFELRESRIEIDPATGRAVDVTEYPKYVSHRMIEECMLLANETVAERFTALGAPFVYRVHAAPPPEKQEAFVAFLSALGIVFKGGPHPRPKDYADLLDSVDAAVKPAVSRVALRTMSKAEYKTEDLGHFGLAAPFYCHFTSPIRRYPDLAVHRIVKAWLKGAKLGGFADFAAEAARAGSEREREAEAVEREVDDLKKAEFMEDKIGRRYAGVVSGVTEWGLFVELDNTVEGLVRTESLPDGGYTFNPALLRLDNRTHSYRIGDRMEIVVDSVHDGKVGFVPADRRAAGGQRPADI